MTSPLRPITPPAPTGNQPVLRLRQVSKSFFGVRVLHDVTFDLAAGRVLGLVGENGAGKSTLMNILGGSLRPDAGTMLLDDRPYAPHSPRDARLAGIGLVHQELNLFPNLTIAENLFLTSPPTRFGLLRRRQVRQHTAVLLERVGLRVHPDSLLERLSPGERQLVEIAHALAFEARLLIFDEPTTSLSAQESQRLFDLISRLRTEGRCILYISHTLPDVLRLSDHLIVLRDGQIVGQSDSAHFDVPRLVALMVGRPIDRLFPSRPASAATRAPNASFAESPPAPCSATERPRSPSLLEARGVSQPGILEDVSLVLHPGEILGLAGLMGAGRTELARILFGLDPITSGEILLDGRPLPRSPRQSIRRNLALLTEDRRDDGLCLDASVAENITLVTLPTQSRGPLRLLDLAALQSAIQRVREATRLQPRIRDAQPVRTLSGGNQQKVVLAKWLVARPRILILDEPTRGIDVGARHEIYQLIFQLADSGAGILLISSELEELTGLSDRILVMRQGRISGEFHRPPFDREQLLGAALPLEPNLRGPRAVGTWGCGVKSAGLGADADNG